MAWHSPETSAQSSSPAGEIFVPTPWRLEWEAGSLVLTLHPTQRIQMPLVGRREGLPTTCPGSGFVPWDLTERIFASLRKQPQTRATKERPPGPGRDGSGPRPTLYSKGVLFFFRLPV